jgi:hypothetical protein
VLVARFVTTCFEAECVGGLPTSGLVIHNLQAEHAGSRFHPDKGLNCLNNSIAAAECLGACLLGSMYIHKEAPSALLCHMLKPATNLQAAGHPCM